MGGKPLAIVTSDRACPWQDAVSWIELNLLTCRHLSSPLVIRTFAGSVLRLGMHGVPGDEAILFAACTVWSPGGRS